MSGRNRPSMHPMQTYPFMSQMAIAEAPRITCQQYTHIRGPNLARKTSADVQAVVSAMHIITIMTICMFTSVAPMMQARLVLLIFPGVDTSTLQFALLAVASMATAPIPATSAIAKSQPCKRPPNIAMETIANRVPTMDVCN